MTDDIRPTYVGTGQCTCGRLDEQLYVISTIDQVGLCRRCLETSGIHVEPARTGEDLEVVNGKLTWKDSALLSSKKEKG